MNDQDFEELLAGTLSQIQEVLGVKAREYAPGGDRLHNFKIAAAYMQCTEEQACFSYLTKHLVSLADMVKSGKIHPNEVWDEKIGDALNYLILLRAIVAERDHEGFVKHIAVTQNAAPPTANNH